MLNNKSKSYWLFLAPSLIGMLLVLFIPLFMGTYYSFTNWDGLSSTAMVGFENYMKAFQDQTFINSLIFTAKFSVVSIILINVIALLLAQLVTQKLGAWNTFFRTVFFMPNLIGGIILGFIWQFVFNKAFQGIADLTGIHFFANWLSTPTTAFWGLTILFVWQMSGYMMIIYVSFINSISDDILEAAAIDGATGLQSFFRVKLPMLMPAFTITLFLTLGSSLKIYDQVLALTQGGPFNSSQTTAMNIYNEAFQNNNMAYAQAKAVIFLALIVIVSIIQIRITSKKEISA
ncbi:MAG: sugar ABC transporter permease [Streptococcaceae bacterium]|jgi:raffinose/stachyose/melibiose transport system permease protein|nr:sugar ABC transporter permease [Streptococcaceae bacterium]